jgi:hypothetical protein
LGGRTVDVSWLRRLFGGSDPRSSETAQNLSEASSRRDDEWIELPSVGVDGAPWAGELWSQQPVYAPRRVDVGAFLQQRPMPYVWPNDVRYHDFVDSSEGDSTEWLVKSWLYVFLHHPDKAVVINALRQPQLNASILHSVAIADLIMFHPDPAVREEAVHAVWRLDDAEVRRVVRVLRDDFDLPPPQRAPYGRDAVDRVLAAQLPERTALAAELRLNQR